MKSSIKKIAALLLVLAVMIPLCIIGTSADPDPDPTPTYTANPDWKPNDAKVFEIATPADLLAFAAKRTSYGNYKDYTVALTADIDLNPGWDASTKTAPTNVWAENNMFFFYGTLDGRGHTIKGLYQAGGNNGCFIVAGMTTDVKARIKNLKVENSYFQGTKNAGFIAAARGNFWLEDVYVDAIIESDGNAGGFVSWYYCTVNTTSPKATLTRCVFAGTVTAKDAAGGIIGTNNRDREKGAATNGNIGKGNYEIFLTDCANYGTITSETATKVGGLVGDCVNGATLTRCYNYGSVVVYTPEVPANGDDPAVPASTAPGTALLNINNGILAVDANNDSVTPAIAIADCYYLETSGATGIVKAAAAPANVTLTYAGVEATEAQTATVEALVALDAFKASETHIGWVANDGNTLAMPLTTMDVLNGHTYGEGVVVPASCTAMGYTSHTCTRCGLAYNDTYTDMIAHTESDWIVDTQATEARAGLRHIECTVCHKSLRSEIIPKLTPAATDAPATNEAPTSEAPTTETPVTPKKKGCGSSIAISGALGIIATLTLGATAISKKKK